VSNVGTRTGLSVVYISSRYLQTHGTPNPVQFRALLPDSGHSFSWQISSSTPKRCGFISFAPDRIGTQIATYDKQARIGHLSRRTAP
jgi:hypothetical protein